MDKSSAPDIPLTDQQLAWNEWNRRYRYGALGTLSQRQAQVILGWCAKLRRTDLAILDLGCGSGWMSERLLAYGAVVATDLADEVIEDARQRLPQVTFVAGDLFSVDLPLRAFDVIVSIEVLAHAADRERFIRRAAELLRDGGLLMIATQNCFVLERWDEIKGPAAGQIRHWVGVRELRRLLARHFDVMALTSVMPAGNGGLLRLVNSTKLNKLLAPLVSEHALDKAKERMLLGRSLLVLARKRGAEDAP